MMVSVDVTGPGFDVVDTEFACFQACPPRALGTVLPLEFWGLLLRTSGGQCISVPELPFSCHDHSVFIAGWAQLLFQEPEFLDFSVTLYADSGASFRRDDHGDVVRIERSVSRQPSGETYRYDTGGHLLWPNGDAQVTIRAAGPVTIDFLTEDCMTALEFEQKSEGIEFPLTPFSVLSTR